jgi:hypothetical protein
MPYRFVFQHLLIPTHFGAMGGLDYFLIILGALLAALMVHVQVE